MNIKGHLKIPAINVLLSNINYYPCMSILESLGASYRSNTGYNNSRYSIVGIIPKERLFSIDGKDFLFSYATKSKTKVDWLDEIDRFCCINFVSEVSPQLGAIGYIGYEKKNDFEKLNQKNQDTTNIPDVQIVNYSLLYWFDHKLNEGCFVYDDSISVKKIDTIEQRSLFFSKSNNTTYFTDSFALLEKVKEDFDYDYYERSIKKCLDYINSGDIFQANITVRFRSRYKGDPIMLYLSLRESTPNPFFAYLNFEQPVISTSPERFFRIRGDKIETNPIKGTAKFNSDSEKKQKILELKESIKNRAENAITTDLMRNDIGRVCKRGSVEVPKFCIIKKFNNLFHLESLVTGCLKDKILISEVISALFPGGSVTGAPKIRSMDIIDEIENCQRKIYCGTIGFLGRSGYVDTSVAIRTIYFSDSELFFHAGGGITINSSVDDELEELHAKVLNIKESLDSYVISDFNQKVSYEEIRKAEILTNMG